MHKLTQKHLATIRKGVVDRATVIGLRKALNASDRAQRGYSIGATSPGIPFAELDMLISEIHDRKPLVVGELNATGKALLRDKRYAKRLADYMPVINDERLAFQLVDFSDIGSGLAHVVPVYRASSPDYGYFDFRHIPWQSGGRGPEIQGRDF